MELIICLLEKYMVILSLTELWINLYVLFEIFMLFGVVVLFFFSFPIYHINSKY